MHALRALRKRRFALFKESKCCMVSCNKLTSRGASLTLTRRNLYEIVVADPRGEGILGFTQRKALHANLFMSETE